MKRLEPARQQYAWGSTTAIPALLGMADDGAPWAEAWYGTHAAGPTRVCGDGPLSALIEAEPERLLGDDIIWRFGRRLPFLLKLIAPEQPGEALFVPAGSVHAYISGLGVEVMASSDNVLRAGLTTKHIDVPEMLACVDYVAAPPVRPAPEYLSRATRAYYAPVDDFELMVTTVVAADGRLPVPGRGPRILLAVEGAVTLVTQTDSQTLAQGEAVFVGADERSLSVEGEGTLIQADVP